MQNKKKLFYLYFQRMLESKQTFQQVIGSLNKKAGLKSRSIRLVCLFLLILSLHGKQ